jgi:hypothetical protein
MKKKGNLLINIYFLFSLYFFHTDIFSWQFLFSLKHFLLIKIMYCCFDHEHIKLCFLTVVPYLSTFHTFFFITILQLIFVSFWNFMKSHRENKKSKKLKNDKSGNSILVLFPSNMKSSLHKGYDLEIVSTGKVCLTWKEVFFLWFV